MRTSLIIRLCLFLAVASVCVFGLVSHISPGLTQDIRHYERRRELLPPQLVSHFPFKRPSNAQNPQFYYTPGPMQANEEMQLFVTLPRARIDSLITKCEDKAITRHVGFDESYEGEFEMRTQP